MKLAQTERAREGIWVSIRVNITDHVLTAGEWNALQAEREKLERRVAVLLEHCKRRHGCEEME